MDTAVKLSPNFSWDEAIITQHRTINNAIPNDYVRGNVIKTAREMEKVRALLGFSVIVNSWFRCLELNRALGSSDTSDHPTGCAVDFISPKFGTPLDICRRLVGASRAIGFKQLILEHTWVHIAWSHVPNVPPRLEVLSLLASGKYARGLTDKNGKPY